MRFNSFNPTRRQAVLLAAAAPLTLQMDMARASADGTAALSTIDSALQQRLAREGVGFAAAAVDSRGVQLRTVGLSRMGSEQPITADTLFELGSLTKAFVALLLVDGVLKKRHAFDDAVEDALPGGLRLRDSAGAPLRLIDLATHRSGLPRMPLNMATAELGDPYPRYSETRLHSFLSSWKPTFRRGERFEYSNLGYGLLAQVLANRLGLSFDAALRRDVLEPLGLDDMRIARPVPTGDDLAAIGGALAASLSIGPRMAAGHDASRRPAPAWRFDALAGAVGLVGSISSVGRFTQAAVGLRKTGLEEAFALCLRHRVESTHPLHPFGLAWEVSTIVAPEKTRVFYNQDGATAGFSCSLWIEPEQRRGAAVLANAFIETRSLALQALDASIDEDAFNRTLLPAAALVPFVGQYAALDRGHVFSVRMNGAGLWLQGAGQPAFELLPITARRFFIRESAVEVEFGAGDTPGQLLVFHNEQAMLYRRLP